ncbi:MAG: hypothetical protein ACKN9U_00190, partial [Pirellulaceae bacterium]
WSSRHPDRFSWTGRRIALFVMQESRCTGLVETLDGGFDGQVQGLTKIVRWTRENLSLGL